MTGKTLHLLVKFPDATENTWVLSSALPPEQVALYLARSYAFKRKRKSRQRAQFGQN